MFDCPKEMLEEQLEKIKSIIKTDNFSKVNSIINICDLSQDEEKIIKNIIDYIWIYVSNSNASSFLYDVDNFISFMENYSTSKRPNFTLPSKEGKISSLKNDLLVICNGYHIYHDFRYLKRFNANGLYMKETYLGSDHKIYLSKSSMKSKNLNVSNSTKEEVDYNPLIAESFFRYFNNSVASYYVLKDNLSPFNIILTPSFLNDKQELIHLSDLYVEEDGFVDTHTNRLNIIKNNLALRYKNKMHNEVFQQLIEKIELQYAIQTLLKQLIGPMDTNFGNTGIILTHEDNSSFPFIDIAPAYDLDISFNVAKELKESNNISQVEDLNGEPVTISSLMSEFKNILGFKEFVEGVIRKISSDDVALEILDDIHKRTNFTFFEERKVSYANFLNERFKELLTAYKNIFYEEKIDETILGR